jgi:hypothetical protein
MGKSPFGSKSIKAVKKATGIKKGFKSTNVHISSGELKGLLEETYKKGKGANENYGSYQIDKQLSTGRAKVYYNPTSGKTVVAHRGSTNLQDWKENFNYALGIGGKGKAYKKSEAVQKAAEAKYGTNNLETIGHSKGALHAQSLGGKGLIQTLNKPVNLKDIKKVIPKTQIDYKSSRDPVSFLRKYQKGESAKVIKSTTFNPLVEHSTEVLGRIKKGGKKVLRKIKKHIK